LRLANSKWRAKASPKITRKHDPEKGVDREETRGLSVLPSRQLLDELVPRKDRPRHRLGMWRLFHFGQVVDTIDWCKVYFYLHPARSGLDRFSSQNEISRLNNDINHARKFITKRKFMGSVFIRCNLQIGAHVLAQCLSYHEVSFLPYTYVLLVLNSYLAINDDTEVA
jgi:hypothetical protein